MLIDKDKVLAEIERHHSDGLQRLHREYRVADTVLDELSKSISALSSPDEVERWLVTVDDIEHLLPIDKEAEARQYISYMDDAGSEVDGPRRVAIRRLEDTK
jgi:hypothetical protein